MFRFVKKVIKNAINDFPIDVPKKNYTFLQQEAADRPVLQALYEQKRLDAQQRSVLVWKKRQVFREEQNMHAVDLIKEYGFVDFTKEEENIFRKKPANTVESFLVTEMDTYLDYLESLPKEELKRVLTKRDDMPSHMYYPWKFGSKNTEHLNLVLTFSQESRKRIQNIGKKPLFTPHEIWQEMNGFLNAALSHIVLVGFHYEAPDENAFLTIQEKKAAAEQRQEEQDTLNINYKRASQAATHHQSFLKYNSFLGEYARTIEKEKFRRGIKLAKYIIQNPDSDQEIVKKWKQLLSDFERQQHQIPAPALEKYSSSELEKWRSQKENDENLVSCLEEKQQQDTDSFPVLQTRIKDLKNSRTLKEDTTNQTESFLYRVFWVEQAPAIFKEMQDLHKEGFFMDEPLDRLLEANHFSQFHLLKLHVLYAKSAQEQHALQEMYEALSKIYQYHQQYLTDDEILGKYGENLWVDMNRTGLRLAQKIMGNPNSDESDVTEWQGKKEEFSSDLQSRGFSETEGENLDRFLSRLYYDKKQGEENDPIMQRVKELGTVDEIIQNSQLSDEEKAWRVFQVENMPELSRKMRELQKQSFAKEIIHTLSKQLEVALTYFTFYMVQKQIEHMDIEFERERTLDRGWEMEI